MDSLYYQVGKFIVSIIGGIVVILGFIKAGEWFLKIWRKIFGDIGMGILFYSSKWLAYLAALVAFVLIIIKQLDGENFIGAIIMSFFVIIFLTEIFKKD